MKQHLKEINEKLGVTVDEDNEEEVEEEAAVEDKSTEIEDNTEGEPSTEEDLVGVAKVAYIQQEPDQNDDPENITLPMETETTNKEACTLKEKTMKTEVVEPENDENIFVMEEDQTMEGTDMDAIADAVKATLASQPGSSTTIS